MLLVDAFYLCCWFMALGSLPRYWLLVVTTFCLWFCADLDVVAHYFTAISFANLPVLALPVVVVLMLVLLLLVVMSSLLLMPYLPFTLDPCACFS